MFNLEWELLWTDKGFAEYDEKPEMELWDRLKSFVKVPTLSNIFKAYEVYCRVSHQLLEKYNTAQDNKEGTYGIDRMRAQMRCDDAWQYYKSFDTDSFYVFNDKIIRCIIEKTQKVQYKANNTVAEKKYLEVVNNWAHQGMQDRAVLYEFLKEASAKCGSVRIALDDKKFV